MENLIEQIRMKANYISAETSLSENVKSVREHQLEIVESGIRKLCELEVVTNEQVDYCSKALKSIEMLKSLRGKEFRDEAKGLSGLVDKFLSGFKP